MFKALFLAFTLLFSTATFSFAADCEPRYQMENFIKRVAANKWIMYTFNAEITKKVLDNINTARSKAGVEPWNADSFYFANLGNGSVGIALVKNKCQIPETINTIPVIYWVQFLQKLEINPSDFIKVTGGIGA